MADERILRREFLKGAAIAGTAAATAIAPATEAAAQSAPPKPQAPPAASADSDAMVTLSPAEQAFFTAAADTIIPADDLSPSGSDCGVVTFIDRQLASAWGGGAKMYRSGPFRKPPGEGFGYQLALTPREFFAAGITATNAWLKKTRGKEFDRLSLKERDEVLKVMDQGKAELQNFDGKQFMEALLDITMEGFFSDPIYGGNKNKVSWRMIGYPGLPATYANMMDLYRNKLYKPEPQSIADFS
ncbi:gluconate 2-dehydrogenase subunit 3 family protein [Rhodoplanes sp. Z2-YC6860]|uniref:gluconate 2-dehydrogenase subunit 3 family protein n=1 Tax=Rhodoplanes sp. Z2-YC6860 TaxID=674703 RepID=UPI00078E877E|nr:gluconate 2-dehydrogenase subunit 3 family protein [Rhodoplanes sp. Z2-YC6860]AMN41232.1 gluconate 2-dehydrogenase [Rhodoplanes sp. Z2-YC6860]